MWHKALGVLITSVTQTDVSQATWSFDSDAIDLPGDTPDLRVGGQSPTDANLDGLGHVVCDYLLPLTHGQPWDAASCNPADLSFANGQPLAPGQTGTMP